MLHIRLCNSFGTSNLSNILVFDHGVINRKLLSIDLIGRNILIDSQVDGFLLILFILAFRMAV